MRRAIAVGIVTMLALAGCSSTDNGGTADDGAGDGLTITATEYEFDLPDEIAGGIVEVTLDNQGEQRHEAQFIRVADDYDIAGFTAAFKPVIEGGPIPETFETAVGTNEADAGESTTATMTLPEGTYVLFCALEDDEDEDQVGEDDPMGDADTTDDATEADDEAEEGAGDQEGEDGEDNVMHLEKGMLQLVTVTGGADVTPEDMPDSDGVVTAKDYGFDLPELTAGKQHLTFVNSSEEQIHHLVLFEFGEGVDEAAATEVFGKMMAAGEGPPPEGVTPPDEGGYAPVTGPGMATTFDVDLKSGRTYAAVCFIQDRAGGPPHAMAHNMRQFFTVA